MSIVMERVSGAWRAARGVVQGLTASGEGELIMEFAEPYKVGQCFICTDPAFLQADDNIPAIAVFELVGVGEHFNYGDQYVLRCLVGSDFEQIDHELTGVQLERHFKLIPAEFHAGEKFVFKTCVGQAAMGLSKDTPECTLLGQDKEGYKFETPKGCVSVGGAFVEEHLRRIKLAPSDQDFAPNAPAALEA